MEPILHGSGQYSLGRCETLPAGTTLVPYKTGKRTDEGMRYFSLAPPLRRNQGCRGGGPGRPYPNGRPLPRSLRPWEARPSPTPTALQVGTSLARRNRAQTRRLARQALCYFPQQAHDVLIDRLVTGHRHLLSGSCGHTSLALAGSGIKKRCHGHDRPAPPAQRRPVPVVPHPARDHGADPAHARPPDCSDRLPREIVGRGIDQSAIGNKINPSPFPFARGVVGC